MQTLGVYGAGIRKRVRNRGYVCAEILARIQTYRFALRPRELGAQPEREIRGFLRGVYGQAGYEEGNTTTSATLRVASFSGVA